MTKEEILLPLLDKNELFYVYEENNKLIDDGDCIFDVIFEAMEEYKDQELSLLTEKYNKLKEAFEEIVDKYTYLSCHSRQESSNEKLDWYIQAGLMNNKRWE